MFVGHYGVSYATKSAAKAIPLWVLFLAVQLLDVLWAILVLLGVEHLRIVPGFTATNPLDLYDMPYTHSLVGALLWSGVAAIAYRLLRSSSGRRNAVLVAVAVFSHWVLDLVVHRPDLPVYDNVFKMGLGLWNYRVVAFLLEVLFLFGGMFLYLRSTTGRGFGGRYGIPLFGVGMLAVQCVVFFGPPPTGPQAAAITALVAYLLFAWIAFRLEKYRA